MPICEGDFFDPANKWRRVWFPTKMPFEDRVLAYIKAHPEGATYEQCSRELGISQAAVSVAVLGLQDKGILAADAEG